MFCITVRASYSCPDNDMSLDSCLMDNQSSSDVLAVKTAIINAKQSPLSVKANTKIWASSSNLSVSNRNSTIRK